MILNESSKLLPCSPKSGAALTDAGRHAVVTAPDPLQQRYVRAFEAMADWEQSMVVSVLERVAAMLDGGAGQADDASPVLDLGDFTEDRRHGH